MVARSKEESQSEHSAVIQSTLTAVPGYLAASYRGTTGTMAFPLNTTTTRSLNVSHMVDQIDGPTRGTADPDDGAAQAGYACCCTTTVKVPEAEMNMPSLIRWFTITGIIFGLVIFFGIINIFIFHRQEITKKYKRHFSTDSQSQRTPAAQNSLLGGDPEAQQGVRDDRRGFTSLVGQLGYWLRKS